MFKKITVGFVIQDYNEDGICTKTQFVASDQVDWENDEGDPVDVPSQHTYFPFEMVQPN
jgi:hypothetical protein